MSRDITERCILEFRKRKRINRPQPQKPRKESKKRFIINDRGFLADGDSEEGISILYFCTTRQMLLSIAMVDYSKFFDTINAPDNFPRSEVFKLMEQEKRQNGKYSVSFESSRHTRGRQAGS
jgi:hypothetical protein